jgi:hypothetical protein
MDRLRLRENETILTDDAVAEILAKEAKDASIKYSSMGLEAFKSTMYASLGREHWRMLTIHPQIGR